MKSQVALLLFSTLFYKALSLKCIECQPSPLGPCNATVRDCPNQCVTSTSTVFMKGIGMNTSMMTCATPEVCVSGSMNLGIMKAATNNLCCSTDQCNSQTMPVPPPQGPNGKVCYFCDAADCLKPVNCEGNQDRCISAMAPQGGNFVPVKGCTTKSVCDVAGPGPQPGTGLQNFTCCYGNLCNDAETFALSFFLMVAPMLPSVLFK